LPLHLGKQSPTCPLHIREFILTSDLSDDGKYVISGSEDKRVYIWKTAEQIHALTGEDSLSEQEIRVPSEISEGSESMTKKELKVLQKQEKREAKARKKREKDQMKKLAKNEPEHFEAHKDTVISAILAPLKTRRRLSMDGTMLVSADETGCIRIWTCSSPNTDGDGSTSSSSDNLS
jgi:WD40 repeat protein